MTKTEILSADGAPVRRRRRVPQLRREELLDAAFRALQRLGPEKCRVADVTKEAGAAKGTFYLYFSGWQEMLVALRAQILQRYSAEFQRRLDKAGTFDWQAFEAEALRFVRFINVLGPLHRAIFHGSGGADAVQPNSDTQKLISVFLEKARACGTIRPVDPETAAPLLFAVLHTCADCITGRDKDAPALENLQVLLRRWLAVPRPGRA